MMLSEDEKHTLLNAHYVDRHTFMPLDPACAESLVRLGFMSKVEAMGFTIYAITEHGREAARRYGGG